MGRKYKIMSMALDLYIVNLVCYMVPSTFLTTRKQYFSATLKVDLQSILFHKTVIICF